MYLLGGLDNIIAGNMGNINQKLQLRSGGLGSTEFPKEKRGTLKRTSFGGRGGT